MYHNINLPSHLQWNWAAYQSGALKCEDPSIDVPEDCGKAGRTGNVT